MTHCFLVDTHHLPGRCQPKYYLCLTTAPKGEGEGKGEGVDKGVEQDGATVRRRPLLLCATCPPPLCHLSPSSVPPLPHPFKIPTPLPLPFKSSPPRPGLNSQPFSRIFIDPKIWSYQWTYQWTIVL